MELCDFPAHELHEMLKKKEISCRELTAAVLERQEQCEPLLKAFVSFTPETALETAGKVDQKIAAGEGIGPLEGIPIALKDNLCTEGIKTTCSSKMLENFIPPYNATVVEKLKEAGVVLTGKLNMDEFAMGSSTENSAFFTTHNPWDTTRVPGGSSGGSVTSVAAGEAVFALGSDTGGSIRQPAAFCGVVGLKPTYGRVSRYGLVAFASSLDQIGPVTRDVKDTALVLKAISGHDPFDSTSAPLDVPDYPASIEKGVKGLKIGIPKEYFAAGLEPAVEQAVQKAIKQMEEMGAVCAETTMPHTEYALPTYYLVAPAEASSNLARYDGVSYGFRASEAQDTLAMMMQTRSRGFGAEVKRRIMLGSYALSSGYYDAYYLKALKVRTLIKQDFDRAFEKYDLLLTPTTPTTAFKIGEKSDDPLAMYLSDLLTVPVNMAGVPAISLTCGYQDRLPIGLQLIGKPFGEEIILQAAYAFEQANDYYRRRPQLEVRQ